MFGMSSKTSNIEEKSQHNTTTIKCPQILEINYLLEGLLNECHRGIKFLITPSLPSSMPSGSTSFLK